MVGMQGAAWDASFSCVVLCSQARRWLSRGAVPTCVGLQGKEFCYELLLSTSGEAPVVAQQCLTAIRVFTLVFQ